MIKFHCQDCEQKLSVPEEFCGSSVECPACNMINTVPQTATGLANEEFKFSCPSCDQKLSSSIELIGVNINCPSCSSTLSVPDNKSYEEHLHKQEDLAEPHATNVRPSRQKTIRAQKLKKQTKSSSRKAKHTRIKAKKKSSKAPLISILFILLTIGVIIGFQNLSNEGKQAEVATGPHSSLDKEITASQKTTQGLSPQDKITLEKKVQGLKPFLTKYCFECHNEEKEKGGIRLDNIDYKFNDSASVHMWQDVLDVLNIEEMPPEDEAQPSTGELTAFIGDVADNIKLAHKRLAATGGKISMRYLTKREYLSSATDLFGMKIPEDFLPDEVSPEFDTIGSDQFFSLKQYEQFYKASRKVVETNIIDMTAPFDSNTIRYDPEILPAKKAEQDYLRMKALKKLIEANAPLSEITKVDPHIADQGQLDIFKRRYNGKLEKAEKKYNKTNIPGVPGSFVYTTTLRPNSLYKLTATAHSFSESKKVKQEINARAYVNGERLPLNFTPKSGTMTSSEVGFKTGLFDSKVQIRIRAGDDDILDYLSLTGPFKLKDKKMTFFNSLVSPITKKSNASESEIAAMLTKFADRAFRYQGVDKDYITALLKLYRLERENGKGIANSLIEPLTAILTSPAFLYIKEKNDGERNPLSQKEFAIRMAYFLWRSPPDKELYELAASNKLFAPGILRNQFERMLSSNKADHFLIDFINQWSDIERFDEIDIPGDLGKGGFPDSARRAIGEFFKVLVRENLPVDNMIASDFVVADHRLAGHYGFKTRAFTGFKKFKLPDLNPESSIGPRGGMLTQFAFLIMGTNDSRTSPTIRGTIIRDKFLFDEPPPPPPNVPAIEPPEGAKLTVRQLVDRHMNIPQCASCHKKIDPIGLGLENFDYLGKWRTEELIKAEPVKNTRKGKANTKITPPETVPVLANGHLDGESFKDFKGLQRVLLKHKDKLAISIYESMMSYGIGRKIEFIDKAEINENLIELKKKNYPLKEMVFEILSSQMFATK
ncbi:DUF1588 domain-containing protein [Lentisphaera marina]|uniref:DUF1588 domain-containing protein n=1 Tax=Lentisphaera marina TaxID=1111041 RepID=UPI002365250F|nr:DUF1588 domain-containing protein [Lentisphaera marina]MDD7983946.1 DUF1588 domain-containing protein [Lentisphaera marina]